MPIPKTQILQFTEEDVENVRKLFGIDEQKIKQSIEILRNWLKQQQHLPQVADDDFLERMLLRNKFRIEQTKQKLDNYYTIRGLLPDYVLDNYNAMMPSKEVRQTLPLPKLTKAKERVILMYKTDQDDEANITRYITLMNAVVEFLVHNDYSVGDKVIVDCRNVPFKDMTAWTVTKLSHILKLYTKAYSGRIRSIDVINPPSFISAMASLMKIVLPDKIYKRFQVHNDLESLYKSVPKEILPADLGGDLETVEELAEKFDQVFIEHYEFFNIITKQTSNEALRIGEVRKDELYGIEGNFRKLDID